MIICYSQHKSEDFYQIHTARNLDLAETEQSFYRMTFFFIMSKQVLISLLAQGNTGNEILSILDAIVADQASEQGYNEPTADVIDF